MIAVVDTGIGNLESVLRAFRKIGVAVQLAPDPEGLAGADRIVLPGVGYFDKAMARLEETGLRTALDRMVLEQGVPVLGICLGYQLLTRHSAEGDCAGLGWIDAETKPFEFGPEDTRHKIPHIGWNDLTAREKTPLLRGIPERACFYFAHSYYVVCHDAAVSRATTTYGPTFTCMVERDNVLGTQFHPEKSHDAGALMLRNFLEVTSGA